MAAPSVYDTGVLLRHLRVSFERCDFDDMPAVPKMA